MNQYVTFPLFEFVGPKCKDVPCKGTLVVFYNLRTKETFYKCTECNKEFPKVYTEKIEKFEHEDEDDDLGDL